MAVRYTEVTPLAELDPVELGIELAELVAQTLPWLEGISGARATVAPAEGKWSAKEVVGHLVDSAVNNLQRIVRLQTAQSAESEVQSQNYDADGWVRAQHYAGKEWVEGVELWRVLNEHIAWTMRQVERSHLGRVCVMPDGRVTFGFLMEDYIAHIGHHLRALQIWL